MNRQETSAMLAILRTVWPQTPITDDTITAYQWAFEHTSYDLVQDACRRWIRTGKFFPKPAELLEIISVQTVAPELVPEAAWSEVQREVRRVGFNRLPEFRNGQFVDPPKPAFSSPLIGDAVTAIGWQELCTSDQPGIVRTQFTKTLQALMTRAIRERQVGGQIGVSDSRIAAGVVNLAEALAMKRVAS